MGRDPACGEGENPLSRGPSGLLRSSKSGRNWATSVETTGHPSTDLTKAKRMGRDPAGVEGGNPLSRAPRGLLRSGNSGKHRRTTAVGNLQLTTIATE